MDEKKQRSEPDLTRIHPRYTWETDTDSGEQDEVGDEERDLSSPARARDVVGKLDAEIRRLTSALEDVVALALSEVDHRQRAIMMQRRAIAALSGLDAEPAPRRSPDQG